MLTLFMKYVVALFIRILRVLLSAKYTCFFFYQKVPLLFGPNVQGEEKRGLRGKVWGKKRVTK